MMLSLIRFYCCLLLVRLGSLTTLAFHRKCGKVGGDGGGGVELNRETQCFQNFSYSLFWPQSGSLSRLVRAEMKLVLALIAALRGKRVQTVHLYIQRLRRGWVWRKQLSVRGRVALFRVWLVDGRWWRRQVGLPLCRPILSWWKLELS